MKITIFDEQARLKEKIDDWLNGQRTWLELVAKRRKACLDVPKAL